MIGSTISYNSCSPLVFVERMLNNLMYIQNIIQPILLPASKQKGDVLFQQCNAWLHDAHMLLKMFGNLLCWYNWWTCLPMNMFWIWWNDTYLVQLYFLLYCINRCKNQGVVLPWFLHSIIVCIVCTQLYRNVFTICIIVCMP